MTATLVRRGPAARRVAAVALMAWALALTPPAADAADAPRLLPLPDVRQHTTYACGAAALQAVLAYFGEDVRGDELMADLGTNADIGTRWWEIVRVARSRGIEAVSRQHMTADDLAAHLARREPVMLAIQAYPEQLPRDSAGWKALTLDGHYVVAVGQDADNFYFEDPAMFGVGLTPREELEARWHDVAESDAPFEHFGIAFRRAKGADAVVASHATPIK